MSKRVTIYASPPLQRVLRVTPDRPPSGRLASVCGRYDALIAEGLVRIDRLHENEWCALVDTLNATMRDQDGAAQMIACGISDDPEVMAKWDVDPTRIQRILEQAGLPGQMAVLEIADRFWHRDEPDSVTQRLRAAGAPI